MSLPHSEASPPPSPSSSEEDYDLPSINAVNWDFLSSRAQGLLQASSVTVTDGSLSGGFNIVRMIELVVTSEDVSEATIKTIVARVPRVQSQEGPGRGGTFCNDAEYECVRDKMASEIATMRFVREKTNITTPVILDYNLERDGGGAGLPYMLMTLAEGQPLHLRWPSMCADDRKEFLRQIVDVYLELWKHPFDKIGSLYYVDSPEQDHGNNADCTSTPPGYTIGKLTRMSHEDEPVYAPSFIRALDKCTPKTSTRDFWASVADERLEDISRMNFGSNEKIYGYARMWLVRSFIPDLYPLQTTCTPSSSSSSSSPHVKEGQLEQEPSLLSHGFRLLHGDFNLHNIFASGMKITSVIDWETSAICLPSTFTQLPTFLEEDPYLDLEEDHPHVRWVKHDRPVFFGLLNDAAQAAAADPDAQEGGSLNSSGNTTVTSLAAAFNIPTAVRLTERLLQFEMDHLVLRNLFAEVYNISFDDVWQIVKQNHVIPLITPRAGKETGGELVEIAVRFKREAEIMEEARKILGPEMFAIIGPSDAGVIREEFVDVLRKNQVCLNDVLRKWLSTYSDRPRVDQGR